MKGSTGIAIGFLAGGLAGAFLSGEASKEGILAGEYLHEMPGGEMAIDGEVEYFWSHGDWVRMERFTIMTQVATEENEYWEARSYLTECTFPEEMRLALDCVTECNEAAYARGGIPEMEATDCPGECAAIPATDQTQARCRAEAGLEG